MANNCVLSFIAGFVDTCVFLYAEAALLLLSYLAVTVKTRSIPPTYRA